MSDGVWPWQTILKTTEGITLLFNVIVNGELELLFNSLPRPEWNGLDSNLKQQVMSADLI